MRNNSAYQAQRARVKAADEAHAAYLIWLAGKLGCTRAELFAHLNRVPGTRLLELKAEHDALLAQGVTP